MKIYHNPRCRKSRETLQILASKGVDVEIVEYLKTPPTQKELKEILIKLGLRPADIIRKGEQIFKDNYKGKDLSDNEWIKVMVENPILIERPILVEGKKAVIGRPPEKVMDIF